VFHAQAHSFAQQARLAITLSWIAGYTNLITVLTCGQVTSHMSGATSEVGRDLVQGDWRRLGYLLLLVAAFVVGALVSGVVSDVGKALRWQSIYVLPMAIEALLLAIFAVGVELHDAARIETGGAFVWMTLVAAAAMGLQNATITRISGGVVRTTHVTGVLTDLGLETAHLLAWLVRGRPAEAHPNPLGPSSAKRLALLASIAGAFAVGAGVGTFAFLKIPTYSMVPPVAFLIWIIAQDLISPIAEVRAATAVGGAPIERLPQGIAVYHLKTKRGARLPNLLLWAEHLPASVRGIVLDVEEFGDLDEDACIEIGALAARLRSHHRHLVLAGVAPDRYRALESAGVLEEIGGMNLCHDLELAVARALAVIER
jgi:uncharacterized membrane protein YoaK (UPF0700 family)